jgi:hypothetical protein
MELLRLATYLATERANSALIPRVHCWGVAPTYGLLDGVWRLLKEMTPAELIVKINETKLQMELVGDVLIELKSADDPDRLVGSGLDVLVLYEAALIEERAWTVSLRPRLSSPGRAGLMIGGGTPKGRNWWYRLYLRGLGAIDLSEDAVHPDDEVWSLNEPMWASPMISATEVKSLRESMTDRGFRQEIGAEWLDDSGGVFRGVRACIEPGREPQGSVTIGIDWGRLHDWTVLTALDETNHLVGFDRFRELPWKQILQRTVDFIENIGPVRLVIPEATRADDAIVEQLVERLGATIKIEPFVTQAGNKRDLIDRLTLAIDKREISFPDNPILVNELEIYEFQTTQFGRPRFSAPSGYHDDCVMSLALANWGATKPVIKECAYAAVLDLGSDEPLFSSGMRFSANAVRAVFDRDSLYSPDVAGWQERVLDRLRDR